MDWFLYDNGLRHERVKFNLQRPVLIIKQTNIITVAQTIH